MKAAIRLISSAERTWRPGLGATASIRLPKVCADSATLASCARCSVSGP
jgi:hypothetical protein